jgi:hypothetical protein
MRYIVIAMLLVFVACQQQEKKIEDSPKQVIVKSDTVFVDCTDLKRKYDSLLKRNAYLQNAGDSLLRLSITYGFVGQAIKRYLALGESRPPLKKYQGGWIARALRIE